MVARRGGPGLDTNFRTLPIGLLRCASGVSRAHGATSCREGTCVYPRIAPQSPRRRASERVATRRNVDNHDTRHDARPSVGSRRASDITFALQAGLTRRRGRGRRSPARPRRPVSRRSSSPTIPASTASPFVALATAAAATSRIRARHLRDEHRVCAIRSNRIRCRHARRRLPRPRAARHRRRSHPRGVDDDRPRTIRRPRNASRG